GARGVDQPAKGLGVAGRSRDAVFANKGAGDRRVMEKLVSAARLADCLFGPVGLALRLFLSVLAGAIGRVVYRIPRWQADLSRRGRSTPHTPAGHADALEAASASARSAIQEGRRTGLRIRRRTGI